MLLLPPPPLLPLPAFIRRPLAQVSKEQAVFDLGAGSGSLVGFWSPAYAGHSFTVPGFHIHYLSGVREGCTAGPSQAGVVDQLQAAVPSLR
jgi:alpha-acetolactate decarboxylase